MSTVQADPFVMKLRLDSIRRDSVGHIATFYGKPDIHGNAISVPVDAETAERLQVGRQYLFVLAEDVGLTEADL